MGALRSVGLAILTAVAPIAVVIGSSPVHADPPNDVHGGVISTFAEYNIGDSCTCAGLSIWASGQVLMCDSSWHWIRGQEERGPADIGSRPNGEACTEP